MGAWDTCPCGHELQARLEPIQPAEARRLPGLKPDVPYGLVSARWRFPPFRSDGELDACPPLQFVQYGWVCSWDHIGECNERRLLADSTRSP